MDPADYPYVWSDLDAWALVLMAEGRTEAYRRMLAEIEETREADGRSNVTPEELQRLRRQRLWKEHLEELKAKEARK